MRKEILRQCSDLALIEELLERVRHTKHYRTVETLKRVLKVDGISEESIEFHQKLHKNLREAR